MKVILDICCYVTDMQIPKFPSSHYEDENLKYSKYRVTHKEMKGGTIVSLSEFAHGFLKLNAELMTHTRSS